MKYSWFVDGSLSCSGISIFETNTMKHVLTTSIKTKKEDGFDRFEQVRARTIELIKMYPPYEVVFEDSFVRNNDPTKQIQRALGAMFCAFSTAQTKLEPIFYAPNSIKKTVTGSGKATKAAVKKVILRKFPNMKFANLDESDSFSVAIKHFVETRGMQWSYA